MSYVLCPTWWLKFFISIFNLQVDSIYSFNHFLKVALQKQNKFYKSTYLQKITMENRKAYNIDFNNI